MNSLLTTFTPELVCGAGSGFRTRAKLAVRGTVEQPLIGLFKPGTHEVLDLPSSPDHHERLNEALGCLREILARFSIIPYDEEKASGHLRYIQLMLERSTNLVSLTLIANGALAQEALFPLAEFLKKEPLWHSVWINIQEGSTNTIFGKKWTLVWGKEELWEELLSTQICLHPGCFSQSNPVLFEQILQEATLHLLPQKKSLELYAGVGTIGLVLAKACSSMTLVESNPLCAACFHKSRAKLPKELNLYYQTGEAKDFTHLLQTSEVLIVDPPRRGIEYGLMQNILETKNLCQILYISCNEESFLRDAEKLCNAGWELSLRRRYLLFPGTDHVETLGIFKKSG